MADVTALTEQLAAAGVEDVEQAVLSFAGKGMKLNNASDAEEVIKTIKSTSNLRGLRFEGNTVGVEAASAIGEALKDHPEFQLALWSDMFTGRMKTEIAPALKHLTGGLLAANVRLVVLDLSDNAFGPNGVPGFTELLQSSCCFTLQQLKLNNNGLGVTGGKMLAAALDKGYSSSVAAGSPLKLKVFVSGRGRLENEGSSALAKTFKDIGTLEEVSMPQNGINAAGIAALAEGLSHNPNLRILNLNDNTFTEEGAASMANALPKLQKLEVINFGDCLLRTGGVKRLATAIAPHHEKIKELNFGFNECHAAGAIALIEALENKRDLTKLELDGNQFGSEGIELIQATLEAMNRVDILGSFSDDEGTDDEEEEYDSESDVDAGGDGDRVVEEQQEDPDSQEAELEGCDGVEAALRRPSVSRVCALAGREQELARRMLQGSTRHSLDLLLKLSEVSGESDTAFGVVCTCADSVLSNLFNVYTTEPWLAATEIVQSMGLMKSEEKLAPAVRDLSGVCLMLDHAVGQPYCMPEVRQTLATFLSLSHPSLESCYTKHQLLQTLFKY